MLGECFSKVQSESWVPVTDNFSRESISWVNMVEIQLCDSCS